jgi:hypothetical protein
MKSVDLKDKRLNERLQHVLSQLSGHPTASIPAACGGYAEMTAAYRMSIGRTPGSRPSRSC